MHEGFSIADGCPARRGRLMLSMRFFLPRPRIGFPDVAQVGGARRVFGGPPVLARRTAHMNPAGRLVLNEGDRLPAGHARQTSPGEFGLLWQRVHLVRGPAGCGPPRIAGISSKSCDVRGPTPFRSYARKPIRHARRFSGRRETSSSTGERRCDNVGEPPLRGHPVALISVHQHRREGSMPRERANLIEPEPRPADRARSPR
jgi:hypothetical protein